MNCLRPKAAGRSSTYLTTAGNTYTCMCPALVHKSIARHTPPAFTQTHCTQADMRETPAGGVWQSQRDRLQECVCASLSKGVYSSYHPHRVPHILYYRYHSKLMMGALRKETVLASSVLRWPVLTPTRTCMFVLFSFFVFFWFIYDFFFFTFNLSHVISIPHFFSV